jgi:hypothetical protein
MGFLLRMANPSLVRRIAPPSLRDRDRAQRIIQPEVLVRWHRTGFVAIGVGSYFDARNLGARATILYAQEFQKSLICIKIKSMHKKIAKAKYEC